MKIKIVGPQKNVALLNDYPKAVREEAGRVAMIKMQKIFDASQELVPVATGELKGSGFVRPTSGSGAEIRYTAEHAQRIEYDANLRHRNGQAAFVGQPFRAEIKAIKAEMEKAAVAPLKKK